MCAFAKVTVNVNVNVNGEISKCENVKIRMCTSICDITVKVKMCIRHKCEKHEQ